MVSATSLRMWELLATHLRVVGNTKAIAATAAQAEEEVVKVEVVTDEAMAHVVVATQGEEGTDLFRSN